MNLSGLLDTITSGDATDYFQVRRWRATASTWFAKTSGSLRYQHDQTRSEPIRNLLSEEAGHLLVDALGDARQLVPILAEGETMYEFDWVEREAKAALVSALRNERLARKLENTTGRTDAEAETFRQKAADLRG